jgi:3-oxoacyl-[acyl-carrier protein] reductase
MDLGLKGRVALVAASSKGLGRAVAEGLAAEGANLVMCSRDAAAIEAASTAIARQTGVNAIAVAANLSEEPGVQQVLDAANAAFGRVDILVTNTGGPPPGPFESHSIEAWRAATRQNLESVVLLAQGVLPGMKERRWGRIVNVTSIAVKQPVESLILSNSIRAAVTGFARTLANEAAPFNVTVNNVMPGYTLTERLDQLAAHNAEKRGVSRDEAKSVWEKEIPMGRLGRPDEFAAMCVFLASERASYITGQSVAVDGGWIRSIL